MLVISNGLVITLSAHGVELLLEHQSIWSLSNESVARIAFALRNDVTVRSLAPSSKVALPTARVGSPIRTLLMTCVTIVRIGDPDRKSTRLNSSHTVISYAVFCLKKKKK